MQTQSDTRFPFYARVALILLGVYLFIYGLYVAQEILIPLVFASLIAILLTPIVHFLERQKLHRIVAISIAVVAMVLAVLGLIAYIASQVSLFTAALPELKVKLGGLLESLSSLVSRQFHIAPENMDEWIRDIEATMLSNKGAIVGQTFTTITGIIFTATLLPVYVWLILYYQPLLMEFMLKVFGKTNQAAVGEVLIETRGIVQRYLSGLLIETVIVAVMSVGGLVLLGIDYAILLGIVGGFLNMIPYVGTIIAAILPMVIALVTKDDPMYAIWVLAVYLLIQFIDNNYVLPKIVASKVKMNALISVIVVIVGGTLWGIPGMFLSIPMTAILMVICHRVEGLKPWGYLLGDTMPRHAWQGLERFRKRAREQR